MELENALESKFSHVVEKFSNDESAPVYSSLKQLLESKDKNNSGESSRISQIIQRKRAHEEKLQKIEEENLSYRKSLQEKIGKSLESHSKKRMAYLKKIQENEKNKNATVDLKRKEQEKKNREKKKLVESALFENQKKSEDFWEEKYSTLTKMQEYQSSIPTLYEEAVERKKRIEERNEMFGMETKNRIFQKQFEAQGRLENAVKEKQKEFQKYNQKLDFGMLRNKKQLEERENNLISKICDSHYRSQSVLHENKKSLLKRLEMSKFDSQMRFTKTSENFNRNSKSRFQSLTQCRCQPSSPSKLNQMNPEISGLSKYSRNKFSENNRNKSKSYLTVDERYRTIDSERNYKSERRLEKERTISMALRLKNKILMESNQEIRRARFLA